MLDRRPLLVADRFRKLRQCFDSRNMAPNRLPLQFIEKIGTNKKTEATLDLGPLETVCVRSLERLR